MSLRPDGADLIAATIDRGRWQDITYNWAAHARDDQLAPVFAKGGGRWHTWLVLGGRGSGKTRTGAEWIRAQVDGEPPLADRRSRRIALIADTIAQVRSVMIEGVSGLLRVTAANMAALKAELKSIPPAAVRRIYRDRYWLPASCPQLSAPLGFFHFDAAVNQGVTGAARLLQEAVGAEIDGEIGPETLGKAAARPITETLPFYAETRRRHYRSLPTFWRFGKGWLIRVDRTLEAARAIARTQTSPSPAQQQEQASMTDTTQPPVSSPAAPETKWWGQSMTGASSSPRFPPSFQPSARSSASTSRPSWCASWVTRSSSSSRRSVV